MSFLSNINFSSQQKRAFTYFQVFIIVFIPVILLLLPKDFFDEGVAICLSRKLFDIECYACGLTRACMHLIHFDFESAFYYNMGSFIVFPLIATLWIKWFMTVIKEIKYYHVHANSKNGN